MALKRIKKTKSSVIVDDAVENEPTTFIDPIRPSIHQLDYRIMNHPSLRMREIIELGSAGTMADLSETLSSASDWLQKQKAKMKEFLGRMDGVKTLPKTPNRGKTFANVRNTAQLFRSTLPLAEICDNSSNRLWPTFSRVKNGDDEATDRHEDESPSKGTGTENQWKGEEVNEERETVICEDVKNPEQPVQYSGYISDEYVSATESSEQRPYVKMECESPTTVAGPEGVPVLTQTPKIRVKDIHSEEEVFSSNRPSMTPAASDGEFKEYCRMVTRSVAKEKAAEVERSSGQPVRSKRLREQQLLSTVAAVRKEMINRAVAGHSQTRLQRVGHQHVVTTPCKREYKDAVLRVVNEQDLMRNSGDRKVLPTPSRLNRAVPKAPLGALANPRTPYDPHSKEEAEALWRKKEEVAAQLREEQRKERAERARKEREEKALKAQRRRELKELEEKLKAQARRQKEIRDERRREELRLQKSPSRCKFVPRVVSPARVNVLSPCTPGRAPAKLAKILFSPGGVATKEPTKNTPSREFKRKQCLEKKVCMGSADSMESDGVSPGRGVTNPHELFREERPPVMREEPERQERLREEEKRCTEASNREKSFVIEELPNLDMQSGTQKEEVQRYSYEEDERSALQKGGGDVMSRTEEAQCGEEANAYSIEKDENIEVLLEDCENNDKEQKELEEQQVHDNEEQGRIEEQQVQDDEEHLFLNEEKEKSPSIEEQEDILQRLNINSSAELRNRHLDNVSVNTPKANPDVAPLHSSYEITPDKVYKPSTENDYNIEDLSSGDDTDQEDAPRKKVPLWAQGEEFRRELERQSAILRSGKFSLDDYFGEIEPPDLELIFGKSKKYPRRGSSAIWESPIGKPRQGVGAFQKAFIKK